MRHGGMHSISHRDTLVTDTTPIDTAFSIATAERARDCQCNGDTWGRLLVMAFFTTISRVMLMPVLFSVRFVGRRVAMDRVFVRPAIAGVQHRTSENRMYQHNKDANETTDDEHDLPSN